MTPTRNHMETRMVLNNISNNAAKVSDAIVTFTNEYENVCNILYRNKDNVARFIENVPVDTLAAGDDWFPIIGQSVQTKDFGSNTPVIIGPSQKDYSLMARANRFNMGDTDTSECYGPGGFCLS